MSGDDVRVLSRSEFAQLLPVLAPDANKYSRGTVAVIGGSALYPGAPIMSARAAARSGAGYVRLVCPQGATAAARAHLLSIPVTPCPQDEGGSLCAASVPDALAACAKSRVLVIGPGLGTQTGAAQFLRAFLAKLAEQGPRVLVLDADALNLVAHDAELSELAAGFAPVMTPHEGEAARLLGRKVKDRLADACEISAQYAATVVLKGPATLIVEGSTRAVKNEGAGPELAKAGTGDVLSGMIAALAAQGACPFDAAALGVYLHGCAGKLAAAEYGTYAVMPEDIIDAIGIAIRNLGA